MPETLVIETIRPSGVVSVIAARLSLLVGIMPCEAVVSIVHLVLLRAPALTYVWVPPNMFCDT
jgi:hypothetical protein